MGLISVIGIVASADGLRLKQKVRISSLWSEKKYLGTPFSDRGSCGNLLVHCSRPLPTAPIMPKVEVPEGEIQSSDPRFNEIFTLAARQRTTYDDMQSFLRLIQDNRCNISSSSRFLSLSLRPQNSPEAEGACANLLESEEISFSSTAFFRAPTNLLLAICHIPSTKLVVD